MFQGNRSRYAASQSCAFGVGGLVEGRASCLFNIQRILPAKLVEIHKVTLPAMAAPGPYALSSGFGFG